ncbi:hypothetical protein H4219_002080 [Mycoemilia scoparia]|uniref:F-box domain-containing protein n=1 Tax=Mycoemilia scoparia TaxID=417184 RepID=A0A9W8A6N8_9FUNG|nr:hypothetical protein H4219_002080 [Mycoemilia scoparia]
MEDILPTEIKANICRYFNRRIDKKQLNRFRAVSKQWNTISSKYRSESIVTLKGIDNPYSTEEYAYFNDTDIKAYISNVRKIFIGTHNCGPPPETRILQAYPSLEEITVQYTDVNASFLFNLLALNKHVKGLKLIETTTQGLEIFKRISFKQLTSLYIFMYQDVPISIDILDHFENLENLDLHCFEFIINNPNQRKTYPKLQHAKIASSFVHQPGKMPNINQISKVLPNLKLFDYTVGILYRGEEYRTIYKECFECLPPPNSYSPTTALPFELLTELAVPYLTKSFARVIDKHFPNLESLKILMITSMDNEALDAIKYLLVNSNFPRLKQFKISQGILDSFNPLNVEGIFCSGTPPISGPNFIQTRIRSITNLSFGHSSLSSNILFAISQFSKLEKLYLQLRNFDSIERVAATTRCESLVILELGTRGQVDMSVVVPALIKIFPNLRVLKLRFQPRKLSKSIKARYPNISFICDLL